MHYRLPTDDVKLRLVPYHHKVKALAAFREKAKELNASRQQTKNKDREVSL